MAFCSKTMEAIDTLTQSVDGVHSMRLHPAEGFVPKGKKQDCDAGVVESEWVDQYGSGFSGDEFYGTVTWDLGSHFLVVQYHT